MLFIRVGEYRGSLSSGQSLALGTTFSWSILQIEGNEKKPVSFHFTGAFICDTPAIVQENIEMPVDNEKLAQQMVNLSRRCLQMASTWQGYDLDQAIAKEQPQEPYRYHTTRVLERICSGDRQAARNMCGSIARGSGSAAQISLG